MAELTSPGSAGMGRFKVDQTTGELRFDPRTPGGWAEGVTQTRLRGVVQDRSTGALVIADLASVDVTRPVDGGLPSGWRGAHAAHGGVIYAAFLSGHWVDPAKTGAAQIGDLVRVQASAGDTLDAVAPSDAARPTLAAGRLDFSGGKYLALGMPGGPLPSLFAVNGNDWTVSFVAAATTSGTVLGRGGAAEAGRTFQAGVNGNGQVFSIIRGATTSFGSRPPGTPFAMTIRCESGLVSASFDGSSWTSASVGAAEEEGIGIMIAARDGGGFSLVGSIAAVLIFGGAVSDAEAAALHSTHDVIIAGWA